MDTKDISKFLGQLESEGCIKESDVIRVQDGFLLVYKSLDRILSEKDIFDFPDSDGERCACCNFYDDWFLYAVKNGEDYTYSLLKFREQECDSKDGIVADGDTPGITISFIALNCRILLDCIRESTDENRRKLNNEINRVVAYRRQQHHKELKKYFVNPESEGAYLAASLYPRHIASFAEEGSLPVPEYYDKIVKKSNLHKKSRRFARLPRFIEEINKEAGRVVCDNESIFIRNQEHPDKYECAVILATHTGNTSEYSFAAEVEYHARFLFPLLKVRIPFLRRSIYDSAIRADMTIGDAEFGWLLPFYRRNSRIVKRQYSLHKDRHGIYLKEGCYE